MTKEKKLEYVLEALESLYGYTQEYIASQFGVKTSAISHWRSKDEKRAKFKRHHMFAFQAAFNIPIEIFENENITTKEQIIEILKNKDNKNTQNSPLTTHNFDKRVLNLLQGKWYVYNYYSISDKIFEDILEIKNIYTTHYNEANQVDYKGEIVDINSFYTTISLKKSNSYAYIILSNRNLEKDLFYAIMVAKSSYYQDDFMQYIIFSKDKLTKDNAKKILGNRDNIQIHLDKNLLDNIVRYGENRLSETILYSNEDYFNFLKSKKWNLYFGLNNFEHTLVFEAKNSIKWYRNNKVLTIGKITFNKNILITFGNTFYIVFDKLYKDYILFIFEGLTFGTQKNITGIGIMSTQKLNREQIKYILGENSYINLSKTWQRLNEMFYGE